MEESRERDSGRPSAAVGEEFVRHLTVCQSRLYAYILSLVCDRDRANDVLQETNVVIWRKADRFRPGTSFEAWAYKIAYFQVLAHRQRIARDRMVFDHGLLDAIAAEAETRGERFEARTGALRRCLDELGRVQRSLLARRYGDGAAVKAIAAELGQTAGRVASRLFRIRKRLLDCIEGRLEEARRGA